MLILGSISLCFVLLRTAQLKYLRREHFAIKREKKKQIYLDWLDFYHVYNERNYFTQFPIIYFLLSKYLLWLGL